eukprot:122029_1
MSFQNKQIEEWSNKDLIDWIQSIDLSKKWKQIMINAIKETCCTGEDWLDLENSSDITNSFDIEIPMLTSRVWREFKQIKKANAKMKTNTVSATTVPSLDDIQIQFKQKVGHEPRSVHQMVAYCKQNQFPYNFKDIKKWWQNKPQSQSQKPKHKKPKTNEFELNIFARGKFCEIPTKVTTNTTIRQVAQLYKAADNVQTPLNKISLFSKERDPLSFDKTLQQVGIVDEQHYIAVKLEDMDLYEQNMHEMRYTHQDIEDKVYLLMYTEFGDVCYSIGGFPLTATLQQATLKYLKEVHASPSLINQITVHRESKQERKPLQMDKTLLQLGFINCYVANVNVKLKGVVESKTDNFQSFDVNVFINGKRCKGLTSSGYETVQSVANKIIDVYKLNNIIVLMTKEGAELPFNKKLAQVGITDAKHYIIVKITDKPAEKKQEKKILPAFELQIFGQSKYWRIYQKVNADTTVKRVKELYKAESGVGTRLINISLIARAKVLPDNATLGQCRITNERHLITVKFKTSPPYGECDFSLHVFADNKYWTMGKVSPYTQVKDVAERYKEHTGVDTAVEDLIISYNSQQLPLNKCLAQVGIISDEYCIMIKRKNSVAKANKNMNDENEEEQKYPGQLNVNKINQSTTSDAELQSNMNVVDLLKQWNLGQYEDVLINEEGYDDIEYWNQISLQELKVMGFKTGHAKKFIDKVSKLVV